jgi:hypothetical protein
MIRLTGSARSARQTDRASHRAAPKQAEDPAVPKLSADTPWRDTAYLPLKRAAHVLGISVASLYRLEREGSLRFRRIAGRTLVRTPGVVVLADTDEPWTASKAGAAARERRAELAKTNWQAAA